MEAATERAGHDIVVVGASAGGVEAVRAVHARDGEQFVAVDRFSAAPTSRR